MSASGVLYRPVVHDGPHTMEQQLLLITQAAHRVWSLWAIPEDDTKVQGRSEKFDEAMRLVYTQCYQTDVFMGGVEYQRQIGKQK